MVEQPGSADEEECFEGMLDQIGCVPISIAFQIAFHSPTVKSIPSRKSYENSPKSDDFGEFLLEQGTGIELAGCISSSLFLAAKCHFSYRNRLVLQLQNTG